jgi:uncharacterized protein (DUF3084 family)
MSGENHRWTTHGHAEINVLQAELSTVRARLGEVLAQLETAVRERDAWQAEQGVMVRSSRSLQEELLRVAAERDAWQANNAKLSGELNDVLAESEELATELAQERTLHQQTIAERDALLDLYDKAKAWATSDPLGAGTEALIAAVAAVGIARGE